MLPDAVRVPGAGEAVMTTTFAGYLDYAGVFMARERGNLLSHETGTVTGYAVERAQERGQLFSAPGDQVYEDQIVGICSKPGDLNMNICKTKHLSNVRSASKEDIVQLTPPKSLSLEEAVEYVQVGAAAPLAAWTREERRLLCPLACVQPSRLTLCCRRMASL
jgi:GTP-binding protein